LAVSSVVFAPVFSNAPAGCALLFCGVQVRTPKQNLHFRFCYKLPTDGHGSFDFPTPPPFHFQPGLLLAFPFRGRGLVRSCLTKNCWVHPFRPSSHTPQGLPGGVSHHRSKPFPTSFPFILFPFFSGVRFFFPFLWNSFPAGLSPRPLWELGLPPRAGRTGRLLLFHHPAILFGNTPFLSGQHLVIFFRFFRGFAKILPLSSVARTPFFTAP